MSKDAYWDGFQATLGGMGAICMIVALAGIAGPLLIAPDSTDISRFDRSGLSILTDHKTGLQYLKSGFALTPRMGLDGKQMKGEEQ